MRAASVLASLAFAFLGHVPVQAQSPGLVLRDATILDVTDGTLNARQTVVVQGNRITAVGPAASVAVPEGARIVDVAGTYLIPGLWDMHVHALWPPASRVDLPLFPALGITGVRDMGNSPMPLDSIRALRDRERRGELLGPRFIAAGPLVDAEPKIWPNSIEVQSTEHGRHVVDSLVAAGADFIKVYNNLSRDVYVAIAERAKQRGIPFVGHTPAAVTPAEVSAAGQRSIEHDDGVPEFWTPDGEVFYETVRGRRGPPSPEEQDSVAARVLRGYDAALCEVLFARFVRNDTWVVPTLTAARGYAFMNDSNLIDDPRTRFIPAGDWVPEFWNYEANRFTRDRSEASWALGRRMFALEQRVAGDMHHAGVPLLAGTDAPNPFAYFGFGLHDELELLVEAGLTPLEALRTATLNPARFLEATDSLGLVEAGKLADLVLLDANPLEDIRNTQRIRAVVANGRLLEREEIERILADVEQASAPEGAPQAPPSRPHMK